jgi:hypothetical protein
MKKRLLIICLLSSSFSLAHSRIGLMPYDPARIIMNEYNIIDDKARNKAKIMGLLLYCEAIFPDLGLTSKAAYDRYLHISMVLFEKKIRQMIAASNKLASVEVEAYRTNHTSYSKSQCVQAINGEM